MIVLTREQRRALFRVFQRIDQTYVTPTRVRSIVERGEIIRVPSGQWKAFRKRVQPAFGLDCVMVHVFGMWLGIERDGYTHS